LFDATLAMAHLGLSVAYTELNQPARARAALERAQSLGKGAPAHDRAHIEARVLQMAAEANPGDRARLAAYRSALDRAVAAHPKDVELLLLRGIAESADPADRGQGSPATAAPYFERALALVPNHFGAEHYLTHALENTGRASEALPHAAAYAKAAPSVPHALHMYGHVLRRVGRIDEAVAQFEAADRLEAAYFKTEKIPPEYEWHYEHNLELLASSYRYQGRMAKAEGLLKTAFEVPSSLAVQMVNKHEWPAFLTSRGRTSEALTAAAVMIGHPSGLVRAAGYIESGQAQLAAGRFQAAAEATNAALKELRAVPDGAALVGTEFEALQGAFFVRTNQQRDKGRAMLQAVAKRMRQAPGPDAWVQTLFALESMARIAREGGDWATAAWAAAEMVAHDPNYAGTHYALALVAEHNGDTRAARAAFALADRHWAKADPGLPELLAIRKAR
jgi:tetratricopeptide (TPR) repeat protein